ncbi:hypothetical protein CVT26_016104 [Gymnopilus dilepis]|uniref:Uncharacterized protein n=1 Tax=Gymnopilus dilepis TaxID=231916 RepID=A0A409WAB3_9AGAR|nr:hypothetical protein CVT26_016104 [Gymnopilus dilepis]
MSTKDGKGITYIVCEPATLRPRRVKDAPGGWNFTINCSQLSTSTSPAPGPALQPPLEGKPDPKPRIILESPASKLLPAPRKVKERQSLDSRPHTARVTTAFWLVLILGAGCSAARLVAVLEGGAVMRWKFGFWNCEARRVMGAEESSKV